MMDDDYTIGDTVEVLVLTKRGKEPEWQPATVEAVYPGAIDVVFDFGQSHQRFTVPDNERVRLRGAAQEGEQWVFSI